MKLTNGRVPTQDDLVDELYRRLRHDDHQVLFTEMTLQLDRAASECASYRIENEAPEDHELKSCLWSDEMEICWKRLDRSIGVLMHTFDDVEKIVKELYFLRELAAAVEQQERDQ